MAVVVESLGNSVGSRAGVIAPTANISQVLGAISACPWPHVPVQYNQDDQLVMEYLQCSINAASYYQYSQEYHYIVVSELNIQISW